MSREGRQEMDKLFRFARTAGYSVIPANASARQMLITHPTTGEWERIATNPAGRQIANERAKLRRIGAPVTEQDVKIYLAVQAAEEAREKAGAAPPPAEPATPAPPPPPAQFQEPAAEEAPPPAAPEPAGDIDAGEATRDPFVARPFRRPHRPTLKDAAMTRPATSYSPAAPPAAGIDVPATAFVLWGSIRERADCQQEMAIDGVAGFSWRGTMSSVFKELWPEMGVDPRKRVNLYLRETENMICLKKGHTPLWWLRGEWRDIAAEPASVIAARSEPAALVSVRTRPRAPEPRLTAGPPAPVTVIRPGRDTTPAPAGAGRLSEATTQAYDAVEAVTAILNRCNALEAQNAQLADENTRLTGTNARLAGELDETRAQLAAIKTALSGLTG